DDRLQAAFLAGQVEPRGVDVAPARLAFARPPARLEAQARSRLLKTRQLRAHPLSIALVQQIEHGLLPELGLRPPEHPPRLLAGVRDPALGIDAQDGVVGALDQQPITRLALLDRAFGRRLGPLGHELERRPPLPADAADHRAVAVDSTPFVVEA